jgi:predicted nucleic acid-binding protein
MPRVVLDTNVLVSALPVLRPRRASGRASARRPGATDCRDPDDDLIIATAVVAKADRLVTGDNDLLALGEHHGVRIVSPRQFNDEF